MGGCPCEFVDCWPDHGQAGRAAVVPDPLSDCLTFSTVINACRFFPLASLAGLAAVTLTLLIVRRPAKRKSFRGTAALKYEPRVSQTWVKDGSSVGQVGINNTTPVTCQRDPMHRRKQEQTATATHQQKQQHQQQRQQQQFSLEN